MASCKLTYFPLRGRAETSRLVMHAAKKQFEDNRIKVADWPTIKPKTPFGNVPVLEVNGEEFGQGMAIATYLAREHGLYGKDSMECLRIDQIHQLREDLLIEEIKVFKEKGEKEKSALVKNMNENVYPRIVKHFNTLIEKNAQKNRGSLFAVGTKLTLADIVIFEGTTTVSEANPTFLKSYPAVSALRKLVAEQDGIKEYLAKREKTPL